MNDLEEEVMALREALREEQHSAAQAALAAGEALTRSEADVNTLSDRVAELEAELAGLADACTPPQLEAPCSSARGKRARSEARRSAQRRRRRPPERRSA